MRLRSAIHSRRLGRALPAPARASLARASLAPAVAAAVSVLLSGSALAGAAQAAAVTGVAGSVAGLVTAPAPLVDPFIGTNGTGNESPGAHAPFGMVTWGPDTPAGGDGGGYRHSDTHITGFSPTHLSGVGCHAAGEVPVLPEVGTVRPTATVAYSHRGETASAGSYAVTLGNHVRVALTATARTGLARFTFPATKRADLAFKLAGDGDEGSAKPSSVRFRVVSGTEVSGTVTSGDFCGSGNRYTVYFDMRFSVPFSHSGTFSGVRLHPGARLLAARARPANATGRGPVPPSVAELAGHPVFHGTPPVPPATALARPAGGYLTFNTTSTQTVLAKVGISYVSRANAQQNLAAEDPGWDFGAITARATAAWNALLGRVRVTAGPDGGGPDGGGPDGGGTEQRVFYTALYRSLSYPSVFSDDNGQYRGMDGKIHTVAAGHAFYTNISGWDVYRTQSQLLAMLDPRVADDAAQSMLADYAQSGELPKWVENNTETHIMVGDPADAILADYRAFGATGFDAATALADMVSEGTYATPNRPGLNYLTNPGYLPRNGTYCGNCNFYAPTSATLEYDTADFAISALAGSLGDTVDQRTFLIRAQDWQNLLNPGSGFFQARTVDGAWLGRSGPPTSETGFAEGDAWQYSGMVPFNLAGLITAKGGDAAMTGYLGHVLSGFSGSVTSSTANMANEPSMELPWEYDYTGQPFETQATVRRIRTALWHATPGGLAGNDDLGTMSAWFVWSALGAYPMTPGTATLALGSPLFTRADVTLGSGATLAIAGGGATATDGTTAGTPYVSSASWEPAGGTAGAWDRADAPGQAVTAGGTLSFDLAASPDMAWAAGSPPPSYPAPHPPGGRTGVIASTVGTELCLDDAHARTANGNKIDIYRCNGSAAQHWAVRTDGTLRTLGKCLTPARDGTASGTAIVLSTCDGSSGQRWRQGPVGTLVDVRSQRCLADPSGSRAKGTQVVLRNCARATDQKWVLPYAGPLPHTGQIRAAAPGKCLADAGGSTRPHNKIDISACKSHTDQRWTVEPDGTIHSRLGGCLDVSHGKTASGSGVDYYPCNNTGAQQWRSQAGGELLNVPARKCLTVPGDGRASGRRLVLSACEGNSAQRWKLP